MRKNKIIVVLMAIFIGSYFLFSLINRAQAEQFNIFWYISLLNSQTPEVDSTPRLWVYQPIIKNNFQYSIDPEKYVEPNNQIVQEKSQELIIQNNKILFDDGSPILVEYLNDKEFSGQEDFWVNPDYFLTHGRQGDCEDLALAEASMLIAKGNPSVVILGITSPQSQLAHAWVETKIKGKTYVVDNDKLVLRDNFYQQKNWQPLYMFNHQTVFTDYDLNWN